LHRLELASFPGAPDISSPPCLLRLLPAGADAGWDLHPLESTALHGARGAQPPRATLAQRADIMAASGSYLLGCATSRPPAVSTPCPGDGVGIYY
jgi:hypothetical protein